MNFHPNKHSFLLLFCFFALSFQTVGNLRAQTGKVHVYSSRPAKKPGIRPDFQQPVSGAHIYLFAVGGNGPNTGAVSLLSGVGVQYDSLGGYVTSDSEGNFNISGLYAQNCPMPDPRVYLMNAGGSAGGGVSNPRLMMISAMPVTCTQLPDVSGVFISEPTTVAAAFALASFADTSDDGISTDSGSSTALTDAFAYANSLVNSENGSILSNVVDIDTVSDVLGACVNSNGTGACDQLDSYTAIPGGASPTNTWEAALSIAVAPTNNVQNLYYLIAPMPPFQPTYTNTPSTWQLSVPTAPLITSMLTDVAQGGNTLTLYGSGFGTDPSAVQVSAGGVLAAVTGVTDAVMTVQIPSSPGSAVVQVFARAMASNPLAAPILASNITIPSNGLVPNPVTAGQNFTVTTEVASLFSGRPSGTVTCTINGGSATQATLTPNTGSTAGSSATLTFPTSTPSSLTVSCSYGGSSTYQPTKTSATATETVNPAAKLPVNVGLSASPTSTTYGDLVQLQATVTPQGNPGQTPSGVVSFYDGSTLLGTVTLNGSTASSPAYNLSITTHTIIAIYPGDSIFAVGNSAGIIVTVAGQPTACLP